MYYETRGGKIHYKEFGAGIPIVMIHGLGCHMGLMINAIEPLFDGDYIRDYNPDMNGVNDKFRRIYVDLPGQGDSFLPMDMATSDDLLEVMIDFIVHVVKEKFILIGESYGGYLARGILSRKINDVIGLGLVCPVGIADRNKRKLPAMNVRVEEKGYIDKVRGIDKVDASKFMEVAVVVNERTFDRYIKDIKDAAPTIDKVFVRKLLKNYLLSFDPDEIIAKTGFHKPSVFITGRQDIVTGYDDFINLYNDYTRGTLLVLDSAGHQLQRENIPVFEIMMKNWLGSINNL